MAHDRGGDAAWRLETAFAQMRLFLEAAGLLETLKEVQQLGADASKNWTETAFDDEVGEEFLLWGGRLYRYLSALEAVFAEPKVSVVSKDVIEILRATQYSITDKSCFPGPPVNETDVHNRIEAVLRCVFPTLLHKPQITKQIKHFQPDTGLPDIGTLIEYKFIGNAGEEKRVADEILADTRGYVSRERTRTWHRWQEGRNRG